jgi:azurin
MRYTGGTFAVPKAIHSHDNGVRLEFAEPLNAADVKDGRFFAQQWNYRIGPAYGSDEYSVRFPGTRGHDVLEVKSAHVLDGGRTLFIEIPQFQPSHQVHLHVGVKAMLSSDFFLTTHRVGPAFTQFPGYVAVAKTATHNHEHHPATPAVAAAQPVRWEQGEAGRALKIQTAAGMQFAQKELRAKAGERISLTLENPDVMPHNWVLIQPGSVERVGQLANQLIAAPDAISKNYVPESADVICNTRVLDPQKTTTIHFTVPAKPGRYPYLCSFPGHWMLMRGELIVE